MVDERRGLIVAIPAALRVEWPDSGHARDLAARLEPIEPYIATRSR